MKSDKYNKTVSVAMSERDFNHLRELARQNKNTPSNLVRNAIKKHILENNQVVS